MMQHNHTTPHTSSQDPTPSLPPVILEQTRALHQFLSQQYKDQNGVAKLFKERAIALDLPFDTKSTQGTENRKLATSIKKKWQASMQAQASIATKPTNNQPAAFDYLTSEELNLLMEMFPDKFHLDLSVSGGGAKGAGLPNALSNMPQHVTKMIKRTSAVSVGALVSAPLACGLSFDRLDSSVQKLSAQAKTFKQNLLNPKKSTTASQTVIEDELKKGITLGLQSAFNDILPKTLKNNKKHLENLMKKRGRVLGVKFDQTTMGKSNQELAKSIFNKLKNSRNSQHATGSNATNPQQEGLESITFAELKLLSQLWPNHFKEFRCFVTIGKRTNIKQGGINLLGNIAHFLFIRVLLGTVISIGTMFTGSLPPQLHINFQGKLLCANNTPNIKVYTAALASAALAPLFPSVDLEIEGKKMRCCDGGYSNNTGIDYDGLDTNGHKQEASKTLWVGYSETKFHEDNVNAAMFSDPAENKSTARKVTAYLSKAKKRFLCFVSLCFRGFIGTSIRNSRKESLLAAKNQGYKPVLLGTEGHGTVDFKGVARDQDTLNRNAKFAMRHHLKVNGFSIQKEEPLQVIALTNTILLALTNKTKDMTTGPYLDDKNKEHRVLLDIGLKSSFATMKENLKKLHQGMGVSYSMTGDLHFALRLAEAITYDKLTPKEATRLIGHRMNINEKSTDTAIEAFNTRTKNIFATGRTKVKAELKRTELNLAQYRTQQKRHMSQRRNKQSLTKKGPNKIPTNRSPDKVEQEYLKKIESLTALKKLYSSPPQYSRSKQNRSQPIPRSSKQFAQQKRGGKFKRLRRRGRTPQKSNTRSRTARANK